MPKRKTTPPAIDTNREILDRKTMLAFLGVSHHTLQILISDGMPVVWAGHKMLFVKSDVIAWMRDRANRKTGEPSGRR